MARTYQGHRFIDFYTSDSKGPSLIEELDNLASELETSRSLLIRVLLREALTARAAAKRQAQGVLNGT